MPIKSPHQEWFRPVSQKRCPCGQKGTQVWSWGEYVRGSWHTVEHFCVHCYTDRVATRLVAHLAQCRCAFVFVGYRGCGLPAWLTLPTTTMEVCPS